MEAELSLKNARFSPIFLFEDLLFLSYRKPREHTFVLVDTVLSKPRFLEQSRDAQNVCAVKIPLKRLKLVTKSS